MPSKDINFTMSFARDLYAVTRMLQGRLRCRGSSNRSCTRSRLRDYRHVNTSLIHCANVPATLHRAFYRPRVECSRSATHTRRYSQESSGNDREAIGLNVKGDNDRRGGYLRRQRSWQLKSYGHGASRFAGEHDGRDETHLRSMDSYRAASERCCSRFPWRISNGRSR